MDSRTASCMALPWLTNDTEYDVQVRHVRLLRGRAMVGHDERDTEGFCRLH